MSFAPTPKIPTTKAYRQILAYYDTYAQTIRQKFIHAQFHRNTTGSIQVEPTTTGNINRTMKFIPRLNQKTATQQFSGIGIVEHYTELTKNNLLPIITMQFNNNMSKSDQLTLQKFKKLQDHVIIKPADKEPWPSVT